MNGTRINWEDQTDLLNILSDIYLFILDILAPILVSDFINL